MTVTAWPLRVRIVWTKFIPCKPMMPGLSYFGATDGIISCGSECNFPEQLKLRTRRITYP